MTLCIIQTSLDIVVVGDEVSEAKGVLPILIAKLSSSRWWA